MRKGRKISRLFIDGAERATITQISIFEQMGCHDAISLSIKNFETTIVLTLKQKPHRWVLFAPVSGRFFFFFHCAITNWPSVDICAFTGIFQLEKATERPLKQLIKIQVRKEHSSASSTPLTSCVIWTRLTGQLTPEHKRHIFTESNCLKAFICWCHIYATFASMCEFKTLNIY